MKKLLPLILLICLVIYGCGNKSENKTNIISVTETTDLSSTAETETSTLVVKETEISEKDLAGTYIGLHGNGITFFIDGTAEYFCKDWIDIETNDEWTIDGQKLSLHSKTLNYDIYTDISGANISSLNFKSDNDEWDDEIYVRISDDSKPKDIDTYISLIEDQLHTTIDRPSENLVIHTGGFVIELPSGYKYIEQKNEDEQQYSNYDDTASMMIWPTTFEYTSEQLRSKKAELEEHFDNNLDKLIMDYFDSSWLYNKKTTDNIKPQNSLGNTYHRTMTDGTHNILLYESWALNISSREAFIIVFMDSDPNGKNAEEYLHALSNAVPEDEYIITDTSKHKESSKTNSSGVDPDLKAFLDSYEDFIDKYVDFMKKFEKNPNDLELLSGYIEIMNKYYDFAKTVDDYNTSEMSDEDYKYYIDVTARCNKKLLAVANSN